MTVAEKLRMGATRPEVAPALFRLLAEAALSRAALDACGIPIALADAASPSRPLSYVNPAFEGFFGHRAAEALGRPAASLLFGNAALAEGVFREDAARTRLSVQRKEGDPVAVEVAVSCVRGSDGRVTHWVLAFVEKA